MPLPGLEALAQSVAVRWVLQAFHLLGNALRFWRVVRHATQSAVAAFPEHAELLSKSTCRVAIGDEAAALARPGRGADRQRLAQALRTGAARGLAFDAAEVLADHIISALQQRLHSGASAAELDAVRGVEKLVRLHDPTPAAADAIHLCRAAARTDLTAFREASVSFSGPRVLLPVRRVEDDQGRGPMVSLEDAANGLAGLSVLEGAAGAGKSTTILQLAELLNDRRPGAVAVLVSAPEWALSSAHDDLLAYCVHKDAFLVQGATAHHLRTLARNGRLTILLDGWNEVTPSSLARMQAGVGRLRRELPRMPILVAARRSTGPAEVDSVLRVEQLTDQLRDDIVRRTVEAGDPRIQVLQTDAAVDEITRTPLYLAAFLAAPANTTPVRGELLHHLVRQHERAASSVAGPDTVGAFHKRYLEALALATLKGESTVLRQEHARRVVFEAAQALLAEGQIGPPPAPDDVLAALTARHLLVRAIGSGQTNYSFPHQEFRDWYASFAVERHLSAGPLESLPNHVADIVDTPAYEGALLFAAERLSRGDEVNAAAISRLVVGTLPIAPMLSAAMLRRSAPAVWDRAANAVVPFARRWHRPGEIDRGFAFMLATGQAAFSDVVWSFVSSPDQQTRLSARRAAPQFSLMPTSFGDNLTQRMLPLPIDVAKDIVLSLVLEGSAAAQEVAVAIAKNMQSGALRAEVAQSLAWRKSHRLLIALLTTFDDGDWNAFAPDAWQLPSELPDELWAKLLQGKRRAAQSELHPVRRVAMLLELVRLGELAMQPVLDEIEADGFDPTEGGGFNVVEAAARLHRQGLADALRRRLAGGLTVGQWAGSLIAGPASEAEGQALLERLSEGAWLSEPERRVAAGLLADDQIALLFRRFLAIRSSNTSRDDAWRARVNRLEDAVSAVPAAAAARVVAQHASLPWDQAAWLVRPLMRIFSARDGGQVEGGSVVQINEDDCLAVLAIAEQWATSFFTRDQGRHDHGAHLAELVGALRQAQGVDLILRLLRDDLTRWHRRRAQPRVPGQPFQWWNPPLGNYRAALCGIGGQAAASAALDLLNDPDFCVDAAEVLCACGREVWPAGLGAGWIDFPAAAERQLAPEPFSEQPHPYAAAILQRIDEIDAEGGEENTIALAINLATAAAGLPCGSRVPDVIGVLATPHAAGSSSYARLRGLASLTAQGHLVPASILEPLCGEALRNWQQQDWGDSDQRFAAVDQWLSLLAFSGTPTQVLPLLSELTGRVHWWMLRQTVSALGCNPRNSAAEALVALGELLPDMAAQDDDWLRAISKHWRHIAAATALIRAVSAPNARAHSWLWRAKHDPLASGVANAVATHDSLRQELVAMAQAGNTKASTVLCAAAAINRDDECLWGSVLEALPSGNMFEPGHHLYELVEALCTDRRPVSWSENAYTIVPRPAAALRQRLFAKACDAGDPGRLAAARLLAYSDSLRDEHGHPDFGERRHPELSRGTPWPFEATHAYAPKSPPTDMS